MPRNNEETPALYYNRPAYFWWALANLLAICFAVVSWMVCLHVFGSPENPRNYAILRKIHRLPALKRYTVLEVPNGTSLDPKDLYKKFIDMQAENLPRYNSQLIRNYLTNFDHPLFLDYIEGEYLVEKVRKLGPTDFIPNGFAVRARAQVKPDELSKPSPYPIVIEYLFPTTSTASLPFRPNDLLVVKKSPNCAAILHVDRITENEEQIISLTVVPIAYGPYKAGDSVAFTTEPPIEVQPGAGFPVFKPGDANH